MATKKQETDYQEASPLSIEVVYDVQPTPYPVVYNNALGDIIELINRAVDCLGVEGFLPPYTHEYIFVRELQKVLENRRRQLEEGVIYWAYNNLVNGDGSQVLPIEDYYPDKELCLTVKKPTEKDLLKKYPELQNQLDELEEERQDVMTINQEAINTLLGEKDYINREIQKLSTNPELDEKEQAIKKRIKSLLLTEDEVLGLRYGKKRINNKE